MSEFKIAQVIQNFEEEFCDLQFPIDTLKKPRCIAGVLHQNVPFGERGGVEEGNL